MKKMTFLTVTGCGLLTVFLISFTAACSRQSESGGTAVILADGSGLQSAGTVDKMENKTAAEETVSAEETARSDNEAAAKEWKTAEQDSGSGGAGSGSGSQISGNDEAGDGSQASGNDGAENGDGGQVSGNDGAQNGDGGQVSGNDGAKNGDGSQISGNDGGNAVSGNQVSGSSVPAGGNDDKQVSGNKIPARQLLRPCAGNVSGNGISGNDVSGNSIAGAASGNSISANNISDSSASGSGVSGNTVPDGVSENTVSGKGVSNNTVSGSSASGNTISGNSASGNTISGNSISGNKVSGNGLSGNAISGNSVSDNAVSDSDIIAHMGRGTARLENPFEKKHYTLDQRQAVRSSHKETLLAKELDQQTISGNNIDFSDIKIACLGDSITQAVNLDNLENYQQFSYPHVLQETLDANKVYNLGIGGSSIGRYWADAFVDRYQNIPEDSDIILIMGGTNDEFCASLVEFGNSVERKKRTFWGDLDELMKGLKKDYPNAEVIFMTPLPNSLQDYLKIQHPYLIPQEKFADVIKELADEHGMEVIDLYNSNILDGHDKDNVLHFMPDGVHPNAEGYEILGEHVAADLIRILQSRQKKGTDSQ